LLDIVSGSGADQSKNAVIFFSSFLLGEQKCINNHFVWAFEGEMVAISTFFVFEKILNQCFFPLKILIIKNGAKHTLFFFGF